jgi:hypothetical protein
MSSWHSPIQRLVSHHFLIITSHHRAFLIIFSVLILHDEKHDETWMRNMTQKGIWAHTYCYEHGLSTAKDVLNYGPTRTHRSHGRM